MTRRAVFEAGPDLARTVIDCHKLRTPEVESFDFGRADVDWRHGSGRHEVDGGRDLRVQRGICRLGQHLERRDRSETKPPRSGRCTRPCGHRSQPRDNRLPDSRIGQRRARGCVKPMVPVEHAGRVRRHVEEVVGRPDRVGAAIPESPPARSCGSACPRSCGSQAPSYPQ